MTNGHIDNAEWRWVFISSGLLIFLILLPYLWAYGAAGSDSHFMGMLVQPIDGNSYVAKMQQGADGNWLFQLPFTPDDHEPVLLFTFYILLGHLARLLALPLALIFHTVRVIGSLFMLLMLYIFAADWTDDVLQRRITWGLASVGGGFGWLTVGLGYITPELTIPEAYPLLAAYANAHFPWAIALILFIAHTVSRLILVEDEASPGLNTKTLGLIVATMTIMSLQPFGLIPLGAGVAVLLVWRWRRRRQLARRELAWALVVLLSALPQLIYLLWVVSPLNPVFVEWAAQHQMKSPPPWDYLLGFGLLLVLAGLAIWKSWSMIADGEHDGDVFLLGWLILNALLLYAPTGLQRRLSIGLILPLAVFAARGLSRVVLPTVRRRWRPMMIAGAFILIAPSTVVALAVPVQGIVTHDALYYLSQEELDGLEWISEHVAPDEVVLASPSYSLFIPAYGQSRVVYGHDFETIRAEERRAAVESFFAGSDCGVVTSEAVSYIAFGPREAALGGGCEPDDEPIYSSDDITIYRVGR